MTKKKQVEKNIKLSEELANYIVGKNVSLPKNQNYDFVAFSVTDQKLNKANEKLVKSLIAEGKKVVKAQQTTNKKNPWNFTILP